MRTPPEEEELRLWTCNARSPRGAYLVVDDIELARAELEERGAQVSTTFHETRLGQEITTRLPGRH